MNQEPPRPLTDMRQWREQTDRRFLWMVVLTLVLLGGGLIGWIYGPPALLTALPCLLGGSGMLLGLWGFLVLIEKLRDRME